MQPETSHVIKAKLGAQKAEEPKSTNRPIKIRLIIAPAIAPVIAPAHTPALTPAIAPAPAPTLTPTLTPALTPALTFPEYFTDL